MPQKVFERHAEQKHDDYVEAKSICADDHHILQVGHRNRCGRTAGLVGATVQALVRFGRPQLFTPRFGVLLIVQRLLQQNVRDNLLLTDNLVVLLRVGVDLEDVFLSIEIVILQLNLSGRNSEWTIREMRELEGDQLDRRSSCECKRKVLLTC